METSLRQAAFKLQSRGRRADEVIQRACPGGRPSVDTVDFFGGRGDAA
jgi:hypothetical protein